MLDQLISTATRRYVSPFDMALVCVGLGERDLAFDWLEKALEDHVWRLIYLKVDPRLGRLRPDPRFASLVRRVGL